MSRHAGPNPGIVAIVFSALFLAGLVPVTLIADSTHFPSPFQPAGEISSYFSTHMVRVGICGALQFGAMIALGIYSATMTSRLRFLGVRAAGVDIAWFGGLAAVLMAMISAMGQWTLSMPGVGDDATLSRAVNDFVFATGGPGYTVPLGLLCAGIAVPGLLSRLLPRYLAIAGIALGVVGELSALSLVIPQALFLVPLTRFPAFVWLVWVGFKLPSIQPETTTRGVDSATR
jgi:hypothetical protein